MSEIIAIIIISAAIGFLIAFGLTGFSLGFTAKVILDNFHLSKMVTAAENANEILIKMLEEETGLIYESIKQFRKKYKKLQKKVKADFEKEND